MRTVLINWALIAITSYAIGFIILKLLLRLMKTDEKNFIAVIPSRNIVRVLLGLAVLTAYAEYFSLVSNVGVFAIYPVVIISLIVVYLCRNEIGAELRIKPSVGTLVGLILILIFAYGTSRGYMHYDTNLYHAQAIRWIEQYGIVPGLANLQSRFGYNSAEFALNALYSLVWYFGQSLHCTAGFFALLSAGIVANVSHIWCKRDESGKRQIHIRVSDYVRLGLVFYLGLIYSEMISPASDYYAQLLIFDIVILWLDMLDSEVDEKLQMAYNGILCILLVYAITIKLSIGLLVLLALIPGIYWIKSKCVSPIITCVISGLIIALPYFIRNYMISGWMLYPSTIIRIGRPDWQIPKGEAQYDAREIGMWGRGITRAEDWSSVTPFNWIGNWFHSLALLEKAWVLASLVAVLLIVICVVRSLIKKTYFENTARMQYELIALFISIGAIFWFCSAPLVRYGYAYLIILPMFAIGGVTSASGVTLLQRANIAIFAVLAVLICVMKAKGLVADIIRTKDMPYYVNQQDYIDGEAYSYEIDGVTIYVAEDAGQIGYYKFPASVDVNDGICLRGTSLEDGFRKK